MEPKRNIDTGWAWVVLVASVFNLMVIGTMSLSIGMFQTEFLKHFDGSTAYISLVCSVCASFQMLIAPLASALCNVGGIRLPMMLGAALLSLGLLFASFVNDLTQLLLCYGFVTGIGFGTVYTPAVIAVGQYFKKNRVLANGIALSANGIGVMSGPHLIGWLIDHYGWRIAVSVFSCITAQVIVSGSLMFPLKSTFSVVSQENISGQEIDIDKKTENGCHSKKTFSSLLRRQFCHNACQAKRKSRGNLTVLRKRTLWILGLHFILQMAGHSVQIVHFPSYVQSVGVYHTKVPSLLTAYGVALTLARILGGVIGNIKKVNLITMYLIEQAFMGVFTMFMPLVAHGFIELIIYEILFGLSYGSSYVLLTPIAIQLFEVDNLATVIGLLFFLGGISYLIGPTVAGVLYDVTSSYSVGFHIGGLMILLGSLLLILIPVLLKRKKRRVILEKEKKDLVVDERTSLDFHSQKHEAQC